MKRRETEGVCEDRLSGLMPDPARLSAVSRSPLARAGARWLSFARGLSRARRRRTAAADTLRFVESLYGNKFTPVEGGAFSFDKVYRTAGGRRFVSETRLSVSVHPRFDLRLLNIAGPHSFGEPAATTPLSRGGAGRRDARHITHSVTNSVAAPSLTAHTWNVLQAGAERVPPSFGYVSVRGRRAPKENEPERLSARGDVKTGASAETTRQTVAQAAATLPLTSLHLLRSITHAPRQEFVNVLLNAHLPALVSRELLSMRTVGESSAATLSKPTAQGAAERRPTTWTYLEPTPRQAPGVAVEARGKSRPLETARRHAAPPLLHVLPPASLLSGLSETSLTLLAGTARHTTYQLSGRAPSPQLLRAHAASQGTREVSAPRTLARTPPRQPAGTLEVLSSLHTFVERVRSTVAGTTHAGGSPFFARPGFEQVSARQRDASSEPAPTYTTSPGLFGRSQEFVRPSAFAESRREASTHGAGARTAHGLFSTQGAPGTAALLFASGLLRRTTGAPNTAAPSPTAETERASRETRAAQPEGMALELIRQRREQVLQLPSPGYVFTQPARPQLEERQVITKASREEIVEVVRKEVHTLAASARAAPAPSRADLAGIADEVYSTLVRRLLVEKERLGRF